MSYEICHCGTRLKGSTCPQCFLKRMEYLQRYEAEMQKSTRLKGKQNMTRIYDDNEENEEKADLRMDDLQDEINDLYRRIAELEKTVRGLCNIQKENWENFYKAVVEKEGK